MFQAHILNLLIGNKASNLTGNAVKLGHCQMKVNQDGKWKLWVGFIIKRYISFSYQQIKFVMFPARKGCLRSACVGHHQLLGCIYNYDLRLRFNISELVAQLDYHLVGGGDPFYLLYFCKISFLNI